MTAALENGVWAGDESCPPGTLLSRRQQLELKFHRREAQASFDVHAKDWYETANQLRRMYPPETSVYVGLGRSPTPLIAMLQEMQAGQAVNFPFSLDGIRHRAHPVILYSENYKGFAQMAQRIFPDPKQLNGKAIVVIDYVSFGQNLYTGGTLLRNELRSRGLNSKVVLLGLDDSPGSTNYITRELEKQSEPMEYQTIPATEDASLSKYHYFAEYPQYVPGVTPIETIQPQPFYNEMRQMAREWILKFGKKSDQESVRIKSANGD